jgi:hypothetical protein
MSTYEVVVLGGLEHRIPAFHPGVTQRLALLKNCSTTLKQAFSDSNPLHIGNSYEVHSYTIFLENSNPNPRVA